MCLEDVGKISNDPETLTYINNFVHPYNGFSNIQTKIQKRSKKFFLSSLIIITLIHSIKEIKKKEVKSGEINIKINYLYTKEEIKAIDEQVTKIYETSSKHILYSLGQ